MKKYLHDPWTGTDLEGYVFLSPMQKGELGEKIVSAVLSSKGFEVDKLSSTMLGHDRIVNGLRTEIKFSVALRDNKNGSGIKKDAFFINHVSKDKSWERLIFMGVNGFNDEENHIVFFTKEDFLENVDKLDSPFRIQQSGNGGTNDDYFVPSKNMLKFLECDWVKNISHW